MLIKKTCSKTGQRKHFSAKELFLLIFQESPHCGKKSTKRMRYVIQRQTVDVTGYKSGNFHHEIGIEDNDFSSHLIEGQTSFTPC